MLKNGRANLERGMSRSAGFRALVFVFGSIAAAVVLTVGGFIAVAGLVEARHLIHAIQRAAM